MSWLYGTKKYSTEKNNAITIVKTFGFNTMFTQRIIHTGRYTNSLWNRALDKLPHTFEPKTVLVLGLGGGGIIGILQRRYPMVKFTVIEWDRAIITMVKELKLADLNGISILCGDAREEVKALKNTYDLIIFDLFTSDDISESVRDPEFIRNLANSLSEKGLLFVNFFTQPKLNLLFESYFSKISLTKFKRWHESYYNFLGLYRNKIFSASNYQVYRSDKNFLKREYGFSLGTSKAAGHAWKFCRITFEKYEGDNEPSPVADKFKIVIWQPTFATYRPDGWHRSFDHLGNKRTAFAKIINPEKYWSNWPRHAQRHRKKWLKNLGLTWVLETVGIDEFTEALKRIQKGKEALIPALAHLERSSRGQGKFLNLTVAKTRDGQIHAGLATVDVPELSQSYHLVSFHDPLAKQNSVGTGLIDNSFKESIEKGFSFLDFGIVWAPGESKTWQGYSQFKAQFATNFIDYPKPLLKFIKAKKG